MVSSEVLRDGSDDDLVDLHLDRLLDGVRDRPCDRVAGIAILSPGRRPSERLLARVSPALPSWARCTDGPTKTRFVLPWISPEGGDASCHSMGTDAEGGASHAFGGMFTL